MDALATPDTANDDCGHVVPYVPRSNILVARPDAVEHMSTDLQPHQQAAMIISQLAVSARELARQITPAELFNSGVSNGRQLDPVSYLVQGLANRFETCCPSHDGKEKA